MVAAVDVGESELLRLVALTQLCKLKSCNVIVNLGGEEEYAYLLHKSIL